MKSCLVVDDSRVIRQVASKIMQSLSFETRDAEDGLSALEACRERMPEVILLGWNLARMNGLEFVSSLRRERSGTHPAVVLCTTENDTTHIAEALSAGANEYLLKPFGRDDVVSKLSGMGLL